MRNGSHQTINYSGGGGGIWRKSPCELGISWFPLCVSMQKFSDIENWFTSLHKTYFSNKIPRTSIGKIFIFWFKWFNIKFLISMARIQDNNWLCITRSCFFVKKHNYLIFIIKIFRGKISFEIHLVTLLLAHTIR